MRGGRTYSKVNVDFAVQRKHFISKQKSTLIVFRDIQLPLLFTVVW